RGGSPTGFRAPPHGRSPRSAAAPRRARGRGSRPRSEGARRTARWSSDLLGLVTDHHPMRGEIDRAHDVAQGGDEQLARWAVDAVDLVLTGPEDLDHVTQLVSRLVDGRHADQLVPVVG